MISIHRNIGTAASDDVSLSILCNLPLLSHSGYVSDDGLIFYWNLCPSNGIKLKDLNPKCVGEALTGVDSGGVCVTKVNCVKYPF